MMRQLKIVPNLAGADQLWYQQKKIKEWEEIKVYKKTRGKLNELERVAAIHK